MSKPTVDLSHLDKLTRQQQLLSETIKQHWPYLQRTTQVYVNRVVKQFGHKFGVSGDRYSIETLAQEILNDTVETALKIADKFDVDRSPKAWLLGIVANKVREWQRDETRQSDKVIAISDLPQAHKLRQQLGSERCSEEEILGLLYQSHESSTPEGQLMLDYLLLLVNENEREILKLAFVDGKSGRSLAAALGIAEGAAYTRKHRAVEKLKKAYWQDNQKQKEGK